MSQNNLEELNRELEQMTAMLNRFGSASGNATKGNSFLAAAQEELNRAEKKNKENKKQLIRTLKGLGGDVGSMISSLSTAEGNFTSINPVIDTATKVTGSFAAMIPFVGSAIKGLVEGAGEVAKFLTSSFEKAYSSFEKLSGSGVLTTFEELVESSRNTKLSYTDLEKVIGSNSEKLSTLGGSATRGRKIFEYVAFTSKDARENFRKLGVTAVEFSDIQVKYMEMQQLSSINQRVDWNATSKDSVEYIKNLNVLSSLTGETREELVKKQRDMANDPRYQAMLQTLPGKAADEVRDLVSIVGAVDKSLGDGLKDVLSAAGNPITDTGKSVAYMLGQMGIDPMEFSRLVNQGIIKSDQAFNILKKNTKQYLQSERYMAAQRGRNNLTTRQYAAAYKLSALSEKDYVRIKEEENAKLEDALKDDKSKNSQLAKTANSLYNTQVVIQDMALSNQTMTLVMKKTAESLEGVTESIYSALGKGLPPYLKARKEEKRLTDELTKEREKLAELEKNLANLNTNQQGVKDTWKRRVDKQQEVVTKKEAGLTTFQNQNAEALGRTPPPSSSSSSGASGASGAQGASGTSGAPTTGGAAPVAPSTPGAATPGSPTDMTSGAQAPGGPQTGAGSGNKGIGVIRDLISSVESVGGSYDSLFSKGTSVPLSTMTIAQVLEYQNQMLRNGAKSTAAGRYQFMSYTLPEYARKAKFDFNTTLFNQQTQDALADILIREKGYDRYKSGQLTARDFLNNLSKAWAGLPSPQKGGGSFYGGDGLNKSHLSVERALATISQAKTGGIFSGPDEGYLATLHGTEAVIPSNGNSNDVSKRSLNSSAVSSAKGDNGSLNDLLKMITNKVQNMITVVDSGMSKQKKIVKNSMV